MNIMKKVSRAAMHFFSNERFALPALGDSSAFCDLSLHTATLVKLHNGCSSCGGECRFESHDFHFVRYEMVFTMNFINVFSLL